MTFCGAGRNALVLTATTAVASVHFSCLLRTPLACVSRHVFCKYFHACYAASVCDVFKLEHVTLLHMLHNCNLHGTCMF